MGVDPRIQNNDDIMSSGEMDVISATNIWTAVILFPKLTFRSFSNTNFLMSLMTIIFKIRASKSTKFK